MFVRGLWHTKAVAAATALQALPKDSKSVFEFLKSSRRAFQTQTNK
jgi:hypothetical protein